MAKSKSARPGLPDPRQNPPYGRDAGAPDAPQKPVGDTCGPLGYSDLGTPKSSWSFGANEAKYHLARPNESLYGATVWATFYNFFSDYKEDTSSEYSHVLRHLHSIDEVVTGLEKLGLRGKVAHLALVGHNEAQYAGLPSDGTVTFNPPIPGSPKVPTDGLVLAHEPAQPTPVTTFKKLDPYLLPNAMLSFFMCNSGAGTRGNSLLIEVSKVLPGRTIVGFCVLVGVGNLGRGRPGNACGADLSKQCWPALDPLTPWGMAAKRALDTKIIHTPALERNGPPFRRANPDCPGTHSAATHDCPGGW
jgi:hypothetical protein